MNMVFILICIFAVISCIEAALIYTTNSEFGIFMAISVPLGLPHRNVFLSYNYEYNFYQPEHIYKYPPILMGDYTDSYLTYPTTGRNFNTTKSHGKRDLRLSSMTRSDFYVMLKDKMERSGYPAESCLLRSICETNASTLGTTNGFLGNLVHIIFSPSSSRDENLPQRYYQAEWMGRHKSDCSMYTLECKENILDLISMSVEQIVQRRRRK
ncbi:uncharacterized protein Dwil_GK27795 [Drosophila willistoni]|uniref:uncharacterized protein LOC26529797 n=1 Tax=Drosophila willistoni TaxID=7260 RepID=UPI00073291A8|nr:uncharacterized protein LOC26529797 [Drosophila willistoni]KRF97952.1 uncharacterized protein Dwil_GK27795 [Drosophila willistoni]